MKTIEELIQIAENNGWNVDIDEKDYTFAQYSNAGQDFFFTLSANTADELITELSDYIEGYNPFDEALLWIRDGHGVNGAPYDADDVFNDMKDCKRMMQELLDAWEGKPKTDTTEKVWVVLKNEVWDGETWDMVIGAYRNESDAELALQYEKDNIFNDWKDEVIDEDSVKSFYAYRDGEYSQFHVNLYMEHVELD